MAGHRQIGACWWNRTEGRSKDKKKRARGRLRNLMASIPKERKDSAEQSKQHMGQQIHGLPVVSGVLCVIGSVFAVVLMVLV